jgi:hypothetical protein
MLLFLTMSSLVAQDGHISSIPDTLDEQLYCSLLYVNKPVRESIVALICLFPEYSWSPICQNIVVDINNKATVMPYKDVMSVLNECLDVCNILSFDKLDMIKTELQQYKTIVEAGKAHISSWKNDEDVNEIITRNFDGSREILQLYTRNLTVDGIETVNGLLTVNGIIALNGRLILNGIDINTIIANAAAAASSGGITAINGDTGTLVTPSGGLVKISGIYSGASVKFTGLGHELDLLVTDINANTYVGLNSGTSGGTSNVGFGRSALNTVTTGQYNGAIGNFALTSLTSGSNNEAIGEETLVGLKTGTYNIGIGANAGSFYNDNESNNILLNNSGITGESNVLRIGADTGTGNQQLNKAFIAGIRDVTTDVDDAIPVLVSSTGQLGTVSSSKRFKENIIPMPTSFSDNLLQLNPTLFNYKQDENKKQTWGLIAEEVQQVFPELVISDKEGLPFTVKYHELPVLLLNELIKLKKENIDIKTLFAHELA